MKKEETEADWLNPDTLNREVAAFYGQKPIAEDDIESALLDPISLEDEITKHHPRLPAGIIDLDFPGGEQA